MLGCADCNRGALQTGMLNEGVRKKWEDASPAALCQPAVLGWALACPLAWLRVMAQDLGDPLVFTGAGPGVRNIASVLGRICLASASCCGILFCFFHAVKKLLTIGTRSVLLVSHRSQECQHGRCAGCRCDLQVRYRAGFWVPASPRQEPLRCVLFAC